MLVRNDPV